MNGFCSVLKRELKGYFATPLAYVFLVIFLGASASQVFKQGWFEMRQADLRVFFLNLPELFILLVPAIAMRLWAEERRSNSIELLFSLPITGTQAVLGKFFAAWGVILLGLLFTFPMVVTVEHLGDPDWGPIITGYIASGLLAGLYLSIGSFFSTLTKNQVIAFVLGVVACSGLFYAGSPRGLDWLTEFLPVWLGGLVEVVENLSLQSRIEGMQRGVLALEDLTFFGFLIAGCLWANIVLLKERRAAG
ncbi:MAG: ABC transporter permease [Planctomycetota bacterium]|jgi:ABC-2 type transport system permease protein